MEDDETITIEGREYLAEFLRKTGKNSWGDLTMAGKVQAAFFVSKKILAKGTEGMDDLKYSAKHDFFGQGVTVAIDKIQYLPTYHGTKHFIIKAWVYINGSGDIEMKNSKLF